MSALPRLAPPRDFGLHEYPGEAVKTIKEPHFSRSQLEEDNRELEVQMGKTYSKPRGIQYKQLVGLKRERKKCEEEEKIMNNRLELLRKEEYKIWRKIKEVHRKTGLIKSLKQRNKERQDEKRAFRKKLERQKSEAVQHGRDMKAKITEKKELRKELFTLQKKENFEKMKSDRIKREKSIEKAFKTMTGIKRSKALSIKKNISLARLSIAQFEKQKAEALSNRLKKEKLLEKHKINKIKKDFTNMCKLEEEWVNKLQNSKVIQDSAFNKLKEALEIEEDSQEDENAQNAREIELMGQASPEKSLFSDSSSEMSEDDGEG